MWSIRPEEHTLTLLVVQIITEFSEIQQKKMCICVSFCPLLLFRYLIDMNIIQSDVSMPLQKERAQSRRECFILFMFVLLLFSYYSGICPLFCVLILRAMQTHQSTHTHTHTLCGLLYHMFLFTGEEGCSIIQVVPFLYIILYLSICYSCCYIFFTFYPHSNFSISLKHKNFCNISRRLQNSRVSIKLF